MTQAETSLSRELTEELVRTLQGGAPCAIGLEAAEVFVRFHARLCDALGHKAGLPASEAENTATAVVEGVLESLSRAGDAMVHSIVMKSIEASEATRH